MTDRAPASPPESPSGAGPRERAASLALPAQLTIYQAAALREALLQPVQDGAQTLELQADAVEELDSAGVQLLLAALQTQQRAGVRLCLRAPSATLCDTLQLLGLRERFDCVEGASA